MFRHYLLSVFLLTGAVPALADYSVSLPEMRFRVLTNDGKPIENIGIQISATADEKTWTTSWKNTVRQVIDPAVGGVLRKNQSRLLTTDAVGEVVVPAQEYSFKRGFFDLPKRGFWYWVAIDGLVSSSCPYVVGKLSLTQTEYRYPESMKGTIEKFAEAKAKMPRCAYYIQSDNQQSIPAPREIVCNTEENLESIEDTLNLMNMKCEEMEANQNLKKAVLDFTERTGEWYWRQKSTLFTVREMAENPHLNEKASFLELLFGLATAGGVYLK